MPNNQHQSMVRLLSIATVSTGMLLARANFVTTAVSTVRAEAPAQTTQASHTSNDEIPESNPYADSTQCIYRAWQLAAQAGHKLPWFAGDAKDWKEGAIEHDLPVSDTIDPSVVGSVAVWQPGAGGASWAGHVGWVVEVKDNQFRVQDRNWVPAADDERWVTWEEGISFIKLEAPKPEPPKAPEPTPAAAPADPAPPAGPPPTPAVAPAAAVQSFDALQPADLAAPVIVQPWAPVAPFSDLGNGQRAGLPVPGIELGQPLPALPGSATPLAAGSLSTVR